jgi:hypothetical protein
MHYKIIIIISTSDKSFENVTSPNHKKKRGMFAAVQFKVFCLPVCYLKTKKIKIYKTIILIVVLCECKTQKTAITIFSVLKTLNLISCNLCYSFTVTDHIRIEINQLKKSLGEISGSHGVECEDGCLLRCCSVWSGRYLLTFQRCILPSLSVRRNYFMFWKVDTMKIVYELNNLWLGPFIFVICVVTSQAGSVKFTTEIEVTEFAPLTYYNILT